MSSYSPPPPRFWASYVEDTGVINHEKIDQGKLFDHINQQHDRVKFAIEQEKDDQRLLMLDRRMIREYNKIMTDIYRKETHTDHYIPWSSHHQVHWKLWIVRYLMHRADTLIADAT